MRLLTSQEFVWTLAPPPDDKTDERRIVIMVYDKDQVMSSVFLNELKKSGVLCLKIFQIDRCTQPEGTVSQFSSDDVIGCVELSLERVRSEPLSCWEIIVRPRLPLRESPVTRLFRKIGGPQPTAELKVFLSSEPADRTDGIQAVAEAESAEVVKSPARLAGASYVEGFDRIVQVGRHDDSKD